MYDLSESRNGFLRDAAKGQFDVQEEMQRKQAEKEMRESGVDKLIAEKEAVKAPAED